MLMFVKTLHPINSLVLDTTEISDFFSMLQECEQRVDSKTASQTWDVLVVQVMLGNYAVRRLI